MKFSCKVDLLLGVPHERVSVADPTQVPPQRPPLAQLLERVWIPVPHLTEQALHAENAPQRAGTEGGNQVISVGLIQICKNISFTKDYRHQ